MKTILLFLSIVLTGIAAFGAEPVYVEMLTGSTYELTWKEKDRSFVTTARVRAKEIDLTTIKPTVLGVVEKTGRTEATDKIDGAFNNVTELILTAAEDLRPGTYDVTLYVQPPPPPPAKQGTIAASPPQKLTLQIIRPAATVQAPMSATIKRVVGNPFGEDTTLETPIILHETGGRSAVRSLTAKIEPPQHDGETTTAMVALQIPDISAAGDSKGTFSYDGKFPLGTATTKAVITSPQLVAPVSIDIQIKTRRHLAYLFGAIVAGLALGYVIRVALANSIAKREVRLQALALVRRMKAEASRRKDATFVTRVSNAANALESAIGGKAAAITLAVATADTELRTSLEDLNQRKIAVVGDIDALTTDVSTPWQLPQTLADLVAEVRNALGSARLKALAEDVDGAKTDAAAIRSTFADCVDSQAQEWALHTRTAADALLSDVPSVPAATKTMLATAVAEVTAQLNAVVTASSATPTSTLAAIDAAERAIRWSFSRPLQQLAEHVQKAIAILNTSAVDDLLEQYRAMLRAPELLPPARAALFALLAKLRTVIVDASADKTAVIASLDAGDYVAAARVAVTRGAERGTLTKAGGALSPSTPDAIVAETRRDQLLMSRLFTTAVPISTIVPLDVLQWQSLTQLAAAKFLRFVLASIGILVVGVMTMHAKFEGTPADLATAFFWGFAIDVSVDALLRLPKP